MIRPGSARAFPRRLRSALAVLLCAVAAGCTSREEARLRDTTLPTYDPSTGRLKELTFDANKNGRIDTWTEMDGARPLRARIDRDEDGTPDRWEYYGENGQVTKVAFSRADNGKPDAWAYPGPSGAIERIEISSAGDENRIDRWERYAPASGQGSSELGPLTAVDEDSNGDGKPDKWETYEAGSLKTVAFDENYDGRPDRRLTYDSGLVSIETEPDGAGGYLKLVRVK